MASQALEFGIEVEVHQAILEVDSTVIVKALGEDGVSLASFDPLIQDAKFFSSSFSSLLYSHVKKDGNKLAYNLTRHSFNVTDYILCGWRMFVACSTIVLFCFSG